MCEQTLFTQLLPDYLFDDEYSGLQQALSEIPDSGVVIPGSAGVGKLRWSMSGRGKRSGLGVNYYLRVEREEIGMLTLYSKNVTDNIAANILKKIRKEIEIV